MKKWFEAYLELDENIDCRAYRTNITSKFIVLISFAILIILMVGNFLYSNIVIFYVNLSLFIVLLASLLLLPKHYRKYSGYFVLHFMAVGILLAVYFNQGQEYTPIWVFLYIFLVMSMHGHTVGLRVSFLFLTLLLALLFSFIGSTVSIMEFVRFTMVSFFTLLVAHLAEMLISRTIDKLITAKTQLESLTRTDALTGLYNRRYFDEVLPQKISAINRSDDVLALVVIDIDHFKDYNDTFGHPAGDIALVAVANLLKLQMKRANDAVFRVGGEEFALLYQAKNEEVALKIIEDIRESVESLDKYCDLQKQITVSAGLLFIKSKQNITAKNAYESVDEVLYKAKNSGRNNIVVSTLLP